MIVSPASAGQRGTTPCGLRLERVRELLAEVASRRMRELGEL